MKIKFLQYVIEYLECYIKHDVWSEFKDPKTVEKAIELKGSIINTCKKAKELLNLEEKTNENS